MQLGTFEIVAIIVVILVFFGPSKIPQLGRAIGETIKGFKKGISGRDDDTRGGPGNQNGSES